MRGLSLPLNHAVPALPPPAPSSPAAVRASAPVWAVVAGCALWAGIPPQAMAQAAGPDPALPAIEVSGGQAAAQRRFDAAASHTAIALDPFTAATPLVNLSELLAGQPGVAVSERQNYAQDLQIAVRGFGSRSTFGVRGVRILVDGIPATMPDGQGQAATAQLPSASQVEVLRGPLAQQYGNAAGGVLQVTTRDPREGGGASASVAAGSYGQRMAEASFDAGDRTLGGLVDISRFETDGWRDHGAARRTHLNAKVVARPSSDTRVTVLVNLFDQPLAQDPLGLTSEQWRADPRQAPAVAYSFDTRKTVRQNQLGLVVEHALSATDSVRARLYGGTRSLSQTLSFSGSAANSAGGVVDLDRDYYGLGAAWMHSDRTAAGLPWSWTVGLDADRLSEHRQGFVNDAGVPGALRRDEQDRAGNTDLFAQVDAWIAPTVRAIAGLRATRVRLAVDDRFPASAANPDDSGERTWHRTSPAVGLVWAASEHLNLYANAGGGIETPTLAEMAYSRTNSGPNYGLEAARNRQFEVGAKWQDGVHRLEAAWFDARTRGEIVPAATVNGRTVYQNADRVRRRGMELGWSARMGAFVPRAAYTYLDAFFASPYTGAGGVAVPSGNRLPGTARHTARLSLDYAPDARWTLGGAVDFSSRVQANDANTEAAPGYAVAGLQAGYGWKTGGTVRWQAWARLDNLFDRRYAGSLIVNDGNGRFFEPAAGRRIMVGLRAQLL
ncbi:ligand-gated channel protein [Paracidovorax avenae]|uniref:TonB-dependent receptor family protein n=1 Tax=Paracidovorax avenae TaxID=80867 RepID=UPI000D1681DF|nr:TonB-dependent receptor [Paracidovorax avenae]AVS90752.1 ligand-gated channel protein [Paracidovorax avenae]AVS99213.1 ligand-gated channel protein [Paracidovorax avenae]AVT06207.1 ligand-gated channel protein [Paracidovorax avenae]AVT20627.1 ligand-gated channel protein [Paracidovorax avenae]